MSRWRQTRLSSLPRDAAAKREAIKAQKEAEAAAAEAPAAE